MIPSYATEDYFAWNGDLSKHTWLFERLLPLLNKQSNSSLAKSASEEKCQGCEPWTVLNVKAI